LFLTSRLAGRGWENIFLIFCKCLLISTPFFSNRTEKILRFANPSPFDVQWPKESEGASMDGPDPVGFLQESDIVTIDQMVAFREVKS
ncbi:hypothetical protein, partial [Hydrogenimonas sp.]